MRRWIVAVLFLITGLVLPAFSQVVKDQYGGLISYNGVTAPTCAGAGYFTTVKVGDRWYFCTPGDDPNYPAGEGHVFFATGLANLLTVSARQAGHNDIPSPDCRPVTGWTLDSGSVYYKDLAWTPDGVEVRGAGVDWEHATTSTSDTADWLPKASSRAAMTAHSYYFDTATSRLYVWLTNGVDPSTKFVNAPWDVQLIYARKYGDNTNNWGWQQLKRMQKWGFNAVGQNSNMSLVGPNATCNNCVWPGTNPKPIPIKMPYIGIRKPAQNASENVGGTLSSAIKDLKHGVNPTHFVVSWGGGATLDEFDPNFRTFWYGALEASDVSNPDNPALRNNDPYYLFVTTDDSDWTIGVGDQVDYVAGDTNPNGGNIVMLTAPVHTYENSNQRMGGQFLYAAQDVRAYTKATNNNPAHGTCGILNPCSLRDYLYDRYSGSIAALNTAWGTANFYTTFDTAGTCVGYDKDRNGKDICTSKLPAKTIGTGDGSTTTFSTCLGTGTYPSCSLTTPISPFSVLLNVGGTDKIGDCPWIRCSSGGLAANTGFLRSPTSGYVTSGTINYATGAVTLTFGAAPAAAAPITASYVSGGWAANGTGLMDEDGSGVWLGNNNYCMTGPDPDFPDFYTCTGEAGNYKAKPAIAFPIGTCTIANHTTQCTGNGIVVSGGTATATITPPSVGARTFVDGQTVYIQGASVAACNGPKVISTTGTTSTSFTFPAGSCTTVPAGSKAFWANSAVGVDLNDWVAELSANFFKIMHDGLRTSHGTFTGTNIPYGGLDNFSGYADSKVLEGAAPYLDLAFIGTYPWAKDTERQPDEFHSAYQYTTHYLGDIPLVNSMIYMAKNDQSGYYCYAGAGQVASQELRGQSYRDTLDYFLNTPTDNGSYATIGVSRWAWQDFEHLGEGIISPDDNAYDGLEDRPGAQTCGYDPANPGTPYYSVTGTPAYSCGGENHDYGDDLTYSTQGNLLWLGVATGTPFEPGVSTIMKGVTVKGVVVK